MDIAQFRLDFPEFANTTMYPDSMIIFWSSIGERITSIYVFGDNYNAVIELFTAHSITIAGQNLQASNFGANVGSTGGAVSSKTVGSGSVSYDTSGSLEKNAGYFNQTTYGRQYYSLVMLYGMGCFQL